jgi:hypothetical protein
MPFNGMGCGADGARERIGKIHEEGGMINLLIGLGVPVAIAAFGLFSIWHG